MLDNTGSKTNFIENILPDTPRKTYYSDKSRTENMAALNMSTNLENSAVTTGQEKFSFHSSLKERQNKRLFKLPYSCTHLIASKVMFKIL